jgi:hypothetical protein
MLGRQNVAQGTQAELNAKLAAIVSSFGKDWLVRAGDSPLQRLWGRRDALATIELLNFGDAVERLNSEDPGWTAGQVKLIKSQDRGNAAGAIFEILGLNLFTRKSCRVVPAPTNKPGFDGTLELNDGSRVLISVKNHGMSNYERDYLASAAKLDALFRSKLIERGLRDAELRALMNACPDKGGWNALRQAVEAIVSQGVGAQPSGPAPNGPSALLLKKIDAMYQPTSASQLSSICQLFAPHHKNEQDKFLGDIQKGCANLVQQTREEQGDDVCRMILLRLSATASIPACIDWANWYFQENPDSPLGVILLYQSAVVSEGGGKQSSVAHFFAPIVGPLFQVWRQRPDGSVRALPQISIFVGSVAANPPTLQLSGDEVSFDISRYYAYQRGDIYKTHNPAFPSGMIDVGSPGPGVTVHLVLEGPGMPPHVLSAINHADKTLELLP